jgi:tetratricopeptide (TPR) repeat protein
LPGNFGSLLAGDYAVDDDESEPDGLNEKKPANAGFGSWQAMLTAAHLRESPEARQRHQEQLATDARSIDAVIGLARLNQIGGRSAAAEAGYRRAVRLETGSARTLDALAGFYVVQNRLNDAIATYYKASLASPDDTIIRQHYALALAKSGQVDDAVAMLATFMDSAEIHYQVGMVLYDRGDLSGSEEQFALAVRDNPDLVPALQLLDTVRLLRKDEFATALNEGDATPISFRPSQRKR